MNKGPGNGSYCNRAADRPTGDLVPMMASLSESSEPESNLNLLVVAFGDQPQARRAATIAMP
jgi:hypothetical protein